MLPTDPPVPPVSWLESLARTLVDDSREDVAVLDTDFRFVTFSEPFARRIAAASGVRVKRGQSLDEAFSHLPEKHATSVRRWGHAMRGERYFASEISRALDGADLCVEIEIRSVFDGTRVVGAVQTARDVSDARARALAERETRTREERYRFLRETIPLPLWSINAEGKVTFVNRLWKSTYQTESTDAINLTLVHPDDREAFLSGWHASTSEQASYQGRCRLLMPDGGYRWHLIVGIPEFRNGELIEWTGMNVDIHDQIERERELVWSEHVGRLLTDDLDLDRILQAFANAAAETSGAAYAAFFRTLSTEDGGVPPFYLSGARRELFERLWTSDSVRVLQTLHPGKGIIRSGDISTDSRFSRSGKGHRMPKGHLPVRSYLAMAVETKSGREAGLLLLAHPEPDRFTSDHERRLRAISAQAGIAIDNAALYDDLVSARDAALAASRTKNEFLANMSHEIRTPLNGVIGTASLLRESNLPEEDHRMVETISASGQTLLRILNEVLDLATIEAGRMEIERTPTDIGVVIADVAALYRGNALAKGVALNCYAPEKPVPSVLADASRLRQVLSNVVSNAIKFTHLGGVEISWSWKAVEQGVRIDLAVRDSGIGIQKDQLARVFDQFTQADGSIRREYGGAGLGLAISRDLVRLMEGHISLESEPGTGTTCHISLSFDPAPIPTPREVEPAPSVGGLRILLAEDNAVNVFVVRSILEKCGCAVDVAEDGLRAIALASEKLYDLILMDLQMPRCDGLQATRVIRETEAHQGRHSVRIVALTANAMESDQLESVAAGMDDFVTKPVTLARIRELLNAQPTLLG